MATVQGAPMVVVPAGAAALAVPASTRPALGIFRGWLLTGVVTTLCAGLTLGPVPRLPVVASPFHVPWWCLAVLFLVAEAQVIHVQFGRNAHSFSLSEIPLLIGLFFTGATGVVLAQVVGAAVALTLRRRQSPLKLAFNLANLTLQTELAALLFLPIIGRGDPTELGSWAVAFAAVLAAGAVSTVSVDIAITLVEGRINVERLAAMIVTTTLGAAADCSLAILVAALLWTRPVLTWLLAVPTVILYAAYQAYVRQREKHQRVEFLYQASRLLHGTGGRQANLLEILTLARMTFRAETVELTAMPVDEGGQALRTALGPGDAMQVQDPCDAAVAGDILAVVGDRSGGVLMPARSADGAEFRAKRRIKDAMTMVLRGETGVLGTVVVADRLGDVSTFDADDLSVFETFAAQLASALDNGRLERRLHRQAFHDSLTGLANRALFHDRLAHALTRRERGVRPVSVLLLDIDDFKLVNDTFGHSAGDELLVETGHRLLECVRPSDTVARLGGDEFAVLLEDATAGEATTTGRRILASMNAPYRVAGRELAVRASIGVVDSRAEAMTVDRLLGRADVAMYHAKARGKGRLEVFDPGLQTAIVERHTLRGDLESALRQRDIVLAYQPFVDLQTGAITAVEALARWHHPSRGMVPPSDFIPLAEETGLIATIGRTILEQACRQAAAWADRCGPSGPLAMSVNVSVRQFQHSDFVEDVRRILQATALPPGRLILEITESVMADGADDVVAKLHSLKSLGVQLAIDDFGTGYSSLSALRRLPVDMLKVAKPFVDGVGVDAAQEAFTHAILRLGTTIELRMVAEGVESEHQADWLRRLGCHLGQGFYFAKPLYAAELEAVLDANGVVAGPGVLVEPPARRPTVLSA